MSLTFHPTDRVLVIAPHPDDESLATGGLILAAKKAGAALRVLFATNGDNNPWPQRWVEKRWHIGTTERKRWGGRRNSEAKEAIESLGLPQESAHFLNFPDQGITHKVLKAEEAALQILCKELEAWQPTLLVLPSPHDLHPDHNALYILFQVALERVHLPQLRQLQFIVHCRRPELVPGKMELQLNEEERHLKRDAILQHHTQMALSRKRFIAYARPTEAYYEPSPAPVLMQGHRIREAYLKDGALTLTVALPSRRWKDISLLVAVESREKGSLRWQLALPIVSGKVRLRNTVTEQLERYATVRISGRHATIRIPLASSLRPSRIFTKLRRRMLFLDDNGWREVPIHIEAPTSAAIPFPAPHNESESKNPQADQSHAANSSHSEDGDLGMTIAPQH